MARQFPANQRLIQAEVSQAERRLRALDVDMARTDQIHLHRDSLELALESRRTVLRLSALVIAGATKLADLLALPGGIMCAAPLMLRYVEKLRVMLVVDAKLLAILNENVQTARDCRAKLVNSRIGLITARQQ